MTTKELELRQFVKDLNFYDKDVLAKTLLYKLVALYW